MTELSIKEIRGLPGSRKYMFSDDTRCGYIILDKYPGHNPEWNLELMKVIPEGYGYGSILLNYVMNDMKVDMTVCAITDESRAFFKKHGMSEKGILYYIILYYNLI